MGNMVTFLKKNWPKVTIISVTIIPVIMQTNWSLYQNSNLLNSILSSDPNRQISTNIKGALCISPFKSLTVLARIPDHMVRI